MKKLLLPLLFACASLLFADGLPTTPYIYVQGAAEEQVAPDMLKLGFSVSITDKDQPTAKAVVSEKSAAVFKLFKQLGIADDAVVAQEITVRENYDYGSKARTLTGYSVTRNFSVLLRDFALYPKLVDGLIDLHIESMNNVQPAYSKAKETAVKLKKFALTQARQQAEDLATSMDAKITGIFAASPIAFGEIPHAIFGGSDEGGTVTLSAFAVGPGGAGNDKYVFEKLTLSERLHVIFLIEPNKK